MTNDNDEKKDEQQTEAQKDDLSDPELQEALTAICAFVDAQVREGWMPIAVVFGNDRGEFRCFQADHIEDVSDLFRCLADAAWFQPPVAPIQCPLGN